MKAKLHFPKAMEGHRNPGRFAFTGGSRNTRSVVECARPLALFLTPASDPWLGMAPAGVFTGLPNG